MKDGGPVYFETNLDRFFVEPWNAVSSLAIALVGVYFWRKYRGKFNENKFLVYVFSPLIFLGGIGSTLFHAFRIHRFFLFFDVLPIALLTLSIAVLLWIIAFRHWFWAVLATVSSFFLRFLIVDLFHMEGQAAINMFYFFNGLLVGIPAIAILFKSGFLAWKYLFYSILLFCLGLLFRYLDDLPDQIFNMGTHFLWHIFTALGSLFIGFYLVQILNFRVQKKTDL